MSMLDAISFGFYGTNIGKPNDFDAWDILADEVHTVCDWDDIDFWALLDSYILAYLAAYTGCPDSF